MRSILILVIAGLLQAQDKPAETQAGTAGSRDHPGQDAHGRFLRSAGEAAGCLQRSGPFSADKNLRTIVVYAPKDVVEQMRKVVAELDRPGSEAAIGRNIEMTMTFLKCSTQACVGSVHASGRSRGCRQAVARRHAVQRHRALGRRASPPPRG